MNKWNRLLQALDQVFGYSDKKKSKFKKVKQYYDERNNEHVIVIEYRVSRDGDGVVQRNPRARVMRDELKLLSQLVTPSRRK